MASYCVFVMMLTLAGQEPAQLERETIGAALGKPVYRDEIRADKNASLASELHRLFVAPAARQYRSENRRAITPSDREIDAATKHFDAEHRKRIKPQEADLRRRLKRTEEKLMQSELPAEERNQLEVEKLSLQARLDPPGRSFAAWMLNHWKFQRHLHEKYGGGRILFQQAGLEAFDATRSWLETLERDGKFRIDDPELRSKLYHYWTTQDHGAFLTEDKERVREFLEPKWLIESKLK